MFNIDLGQVPAESLAIPALIVAGAFIYFFPYLKNHFYNQGLERGKEDAFVEKVSGEISELKAGMSRHERSINRNIQDISQIKSHLKIRSYQFEETPNGTPKGR